MSWALMSIIWQIIGIFCIFYSIYMILYFKMSFVYSVLNTQRHVPQVCINTSSSSRVPLLLRDFSRAMCKRKCHHWGLCSEITCLVCMVLVYILTETNVFTRGVKYCRETDGGVFEPTESSSLQPGVIQSGLSL